jgi:propionyl-CoA carboxylase alpha chain
MLKYMLPKKIIDVSSKIISPMPGVVKNIAVKEGQQVIEGQEICVVEAMKMQNKLVASRSGKVAKINTQIGATVEEGKVLVELE